MQANEIPITKFEIYRFPKEVRAKLEPLKELDNWHGPLAVTSDWLVIAGAVALAELNMWFLPLSLLLIGSRQRALASLLHEGAHKVLARSRRLNRFLSEWFTGYIIFQDFDMYRTSHVEGHHKHLGDPHHDPDLGHYIVTGLYEVRDRHDFVWKHLLKTLIFLNIPQYLRYLITNRLGPILQSPKSVISLLVAHGILFAVLYASVGWYGYLLYWLLPYLTTFQVIGWLSEIAEHFDLFTKSHSTLTISRNRFPSGWERLFIGMHGDNYHQTHHLFPLVPFWNLSKAHDVLMEDENYARHNRLTGGIVSAPAGRRSVLSMILADIYKSAPASVPAYRGKLTHL